MYAIRSYYDRWLEDDHSEGTGEWVKAQNEVTFNYLNKIPYREELKERLSKLWNYEKIMAPFKEGVITSYSIHYTKLYDNKRG